MTISNNGERIVLSTVCKDKNRLLTIEFQLASYPIKSIGLDEKLFDETRLLPILKSAYLVAIREIEGEMNKHPEL